MEQFNQSKIMHLQNPHSAVVDLTAHCKKEFTRDSPDELAEDSGWCSQGSIDPNPRGFSGYDMDCQSSQTHTNSSRQGTYAKQGVRVSFDHNSNFGSQLRQNGYSSATHVSTTNIYNCQANTTSKRQRGSHSIDVERQHASKQSYRHDLKNGLYSHASASRVPVVGKHVTGSREFSMQRTNFSAPNACKNSHPQWDCKPAVETCSATLPNSPSGSFPRQTIISHSKKNTPEQLEPKGVIRVRQSSPVVIDSSDSGDSDVIVMSPTLPTAQPTKTECLSTTLQMFDGQANSSSTRSGRQYVRDTTYALTSKLSTLGPTSCAVASNIAAESKHVTVNADFKSTPKQEAVQKTNDPTKPTHASPGPSMPTSGSIVRPAKRKRKKHRPSPSSSCSMFAPREPEIKLKYARQAQKDEKKQIRVDGSGGSNFCPYVHTELRKGSPACFVVNWVEEEAAILKKGGRHRSSQCSTSAQQQLQQGLVPNTSCLQMGRMRAADSKDKRLHMCSLCGWPANCMGLGDLHGPYYPFGTQGSGSSLASMQAPGSHCLQDHRDQKDFLGREIHGDPRVCQDSFHKSTLHSNKRLCQEEAIDGDGYYTLAGHVLTSAERESGERWVHEDCTIWSTGVFLIKGRLYGLEEAIRLAEQTICSCCHKAGASLGCFFKDCCLKFHYTCARQSDCLLNEENFTMKCPKHKNKSCWPVTR